MEPMEEDAALPPPPGGPGGAALKFGEVKRLNTADLIKAGIEAGNIYTQGADAEVLELPEASAEQRRKQQELMEQIELRRKMQATVVPTSDADVRRLLRQLEEPVTLFGEREMERRDRLRKLLAGMDEEAAAELAVAAEVELPTAPVPPRPTELFYTEGPPELKAARLGLARFSLARAAARLAAARRRRADPDADPAAEAEATARALRALVNQSSEIGDERPISSCQFSPDGTQLATGAWSGTVKVWSMPNCQKQLTIKAHAERVTGVAWHPETSGRMESALALASGATDATARLWSTEGKPLRTLAGHTDRLGRLAFHPGGRLLGTASFDTTWRLWDVESGACLVEQEGHSRAVYAVAFQGDGALAASGGMDALARLWDLRTGRNILSLQGHVKAVLALDFSPSGYQIATGSEDNSARVWDLRKRGVLAILPGHTSLVSQVRFEPGEGAYLLTSGYDNVSRLWAGPAFALAKTLVGHEGKVMGADVSPDGSYLIASAGYDRTIKLFGPDPAAAAEV